MADLVILVLFLSTMQMISCCPDSLKIFNGISVILRYLSGRPPVFEVIVELVFFSLYQLQQVGSMISLSQFRSRNLC